MNNVPSRHTNLPPLITMRPTKYNLENGTSLKRPTTTCTSANPYNIPHLQVKNGTSIIYPTHSELPDGKTVDLDILTKLKKHSEGNDILFNSTKEFISNLSAEATRSSFSSSQIITQNPSSDEKVSTSSINKITNGIEVKKFAPDVKGLLSSLSSLKKSSDTNNLTKSFSGNSSSTQFYPTTTSLSSFASSATSITKPEFVRLSQGRSHSGSMVKVPKDLLAASIRKTITKNSFSNLSKTSQSSVQKTSISTVSNVCSKTAVTKSENLNRLEAKETNGANTADYQNKQSDFFRYGSDSRHTASVRSSFQAQSLVEEFKPSTDTFQATQTKCASYVFKKPKRISERRYATDEKQEPANFTELYENAKRNLLNICIETHNIFNVKKEDSKASTFLESPSKKCYRVEHQTIKSEENKNEELGEKECDKEKTVGLKRHLLNVEDRSNRTKEFQKEKLKPLQVEPPSFFGNGTKAYRLLNNGTPECPEGLNRNMQLVETKFHDEKESTRKSLLDEKCSLLAKSENPLDDNRLFKDHHSSIKCLEFDRSLKEQIFQNNCLDYFDSRMYNTRFYQAMNYYHFYYKHELGNLVDGGDSKNCKEDKIENEIKVDKTCLTDVTKNEKDDKEGQRKEQISTKPIEYPKNKTLTVESKKTDFFTKKSTLPNSAEKKRKVLKYRPYSLRQRIKAARAALLLQSEKPPEESNFVLKTYNERTATQKEWFLAQFDLRRILKRKEPKEKNV